EAREERLGEVARVLGRVALPPHEGEDRIPVAGAEGRERRLRSGRGPVAGGEDQAPARRGEAGVPVHGLGRKSIREPEGSGGRRPSMSPSVARLPLPSLRAVLLFDAIFELIVGAALVLPLSPLGAWWRLSPAVSGAAGAVFFVAGAAIFAMAKRT